MRNDDLIEMLKKSPASAEVLIYDAETKQMESVTGCITGASVTKPSVILYTSAVYSIEVYSDTMGG